MLPNGVVLSSKCAEAPQHSAQAQAIKQELLTPVREALGRLSSPRGSQQTSAFAAGFSQSILDTAQGVVDLAKFVGKALKSIVTRQDELGLQDKAAYYKKVWEALCQQTQYDWEHPEEYRQRMAAAQAYQQQCLVHDQTFNAEQYHLNQAQQAGYVTAEALQFVLGPELLQGAVKAGGGLVGVGAGAKVAKGDKLLGQGVRKFAGNEALEHFSKHGSSLKKVLGRQSYSITNYLDDANHIIKNGTWVPELNGYVKFIGGQGEVKYGFVGINRSTGNITTFHITHARDLAKVAPSLGIN